MLAPPALVITILVSMCVTCAKAQFPISAPGNGGCLVVIEHGDSGSRYIMGFDIATRAMVHQQPSYSAVRFVDGDGVEKVFRAGESVLREGEHELNILLLADRFPVLMPLAFNSIDPSRLVVDETADGWLVTARLIRGQLFPTTLVDGSPNERDAEVQFRFAHDGSLTHRTNLSTGELLPVKLADAPDPRFAPIQTDNGWDVVDIDTWTDAADTRLTDAEVLSTASDAARASAQAQADMMARAADRTTTQPDAAVRGVVDQGRSPSQQRWAWVAAGMVVVSIGLFAWWKRR